MQGSGFFWSTRLAALFIATSVLSGCLDSSGKSVNLEDIVGASVPNGNAAGELSPDGVSQAPPAAVPATKNKAPVLSGSAPKTAAVGQTYLFQPKVSDPDGDSLTFSVSSKPSWASFDPKTGRLWGTPAATHMGSYEEISVSVTDGEATVALPEFEVVVTAAASASSDATLAWEPPVENTDGSALTDLNGYKIYYGVTPGQYTKSIPVSNPGLARYVIEDLTAGTYYFVITALSASGGESAYSAEVTKKIG